MSTYLSSGSKVWLRFPSQDALEKKKGLEPERELRLAFKAPSKQAREVDNQNCVTYFPILIPTWSSRAAALVCYCCCCCFERPAKTVQMPGFARPCSPLKGKAVAVVAAALSRRRSSTMEKRQFLCLDFDPSCMESCFLLATSLQTLQFTQVFCPTSVLLPFFVRYLDMINTLLSLPFRKKRRK